MASYTANLGAAVVDVVVAVHYTQGNGVELAGVFAQLFVGSAQNDHRNGYARQQRSYQHADDQKFGRSVQFFAAFASLLAAFSINAHQFFKEVATFVKEHARIAAQQVARIFIFSVSGQLAYIF